MSLRLHGEPQEDKRLRQMILISAVLHIVVILWVVISASFGPSSQPRAVAYTVELVNPASLGTNLPGGGKKGVRTAAESTNPPKPSQQVAKKEEPQLPRPIQKEAVKIPEQAKPVEKPPVKPVPEKAKVEEKKPEPKKAEPKTEPPKVAKVEEPKSETKKPEPKKEEAKSEPDKTTPKKVEEKKPEPQQMETKPQKNEPKPEKVETKPEEEETKPEVAKPPLKAAEKNAEEKPTSSDAVPSEERDRQIAAALERVKARVQPRDNSEFTEEARGAGPIAKGGAAGEGGGGIARGIEFILYTQELQRRVQESWIVAEKQPGLVASVSFKIQPDGEIQELELTQSSGDGVFDQSVVRAIRKAAPFPPPPQSYAQEFATQKIFMNFGGEGRVN
jgi:colicin import membrane protein